MSNQKISRSFSLRAVHKQILLQNVGVMVKFEEIKIKGFKQYTTTPQRVKKYSGYGATCKRILPFFFKIQYETQFPYCVYFNDKYTT